MAVVTSVSGQSMYDLCLQVYGGFDNYIQLLRDNNITNANFIPNQPTKITYSEQLAQVSNYVYTTATNEVTISGSGGVFDDTFDITFE
jgi:hypothetical protein